MINRNKIAKTAATFGAAITAMYTAPELQAQILEITWQGGNPSVQNSFFFGSADAPLPIDIDQISTLASDFDQWNDTVGRTMRIGGDERNIMSATEVALGQTLDPSTFTGVGSANEQGTLGNQLDNPDLFESTDTAIIGFRTRANNVGWFRVEHSAFGPIIYSDGEYGSDGETLIAGGTPVGGFVAPDTFDVFRGISVSGTLADFAESDDTDASYLPGFTISGNEAPVWLIFDGVAPDATSIRVESSAGTPGLEYTVEAFNWATGEFEEIGVQTELFNNDEVIDFPIVAADHIDAGGEVRTRVGWRLVGFSINFPWQVNVDQVGWNQ